MVVTGWWLGGDRTHGVGDGGDKGGGGGYDGDSEVVIMSVRMAVVMVILMEMVMVVMVDLETEVGSDGGRATLEERWWCHKPAGSFCSTWIEIVNSEEKLL
jgi:hypothetical protein